MKGHPRRPPGPGRAVPPSGSNAPGRLRDSASHGPRASGVDPSAATTRRGAPARGHRAHASQAARPREEQGSRVSPLAALVAIGALFGLTMLALVSDPDTARAWGFSLRHASTWVVIWYAVASLVALLLYGLDKHAAGRGRQRVSERSLLVTGLVGGWPGALLAQQVLRHKTRKAPFLRAFAGTVVLNVSALALWQAPMLSAWWRA